MYFQNTFSYFHFKIYRGNNESADTNCITAEIGNLESPVPHFDAN